MELVSIKRSVWQIASILLLTISVFTQNQLLFILCAIILLATDERLFLFVMLTSSLFENVFSSIGGFSVSSLIYIFCFITLIRSIVHGKTRIKHEFNLKFILLLWGLISIYGSVNAYTSEFFETASNLKFVFFNVFGRFFLFLLIIHSPIVFKNPKEFLRKNSNYLQYIIVIFIVYFEIKAESWIGYSAITRNVIEGIDPNEWSVLLITIFVLSIYDLKKQNKIILFCLYLLVGYFVFKGVSRTGLVCFGIISLFLLYNTKYQFKVLSNTLIICFLVYNLENLISSFLIRNEESNGLGTRYYLWQSTIELVQEKPILGNGISLDIVKNYNEINIQRGEVSHNSILDILSWLGIVGLIIFFTIVYKCINLKNFVKNKISILLFIQFCAMLTLSWVYKDIVWITLAISLIFKLHHNESVTH